MLALAVDLVWGYCGILSLGHAAFFALGGYAMGMYLMRQIGTRGVYGDPMLPDFMVFLNWKELPWFWHGFDMFWFAMLMVVLVPGLLALVFGWFAFRSRVTGVYLSIITQALTYALMLAFFRNDMGFGGNNGFTDFKDLLGFDLALARSADRPVRLHAPSRSAAAISPVAIIVASRAGRVVAAIRDAESRTRFIGYRVESYKLWMFVFSAVLAGIAGALYVPQVGIINPSEFSPINSIEVVIWVAIGGRGTLYGADRRARSWSTTPRPISPTRCPSSGCTSSACCSSSRRCSCPRRRRSGGPWQRKANVSARMNDRSVMQAHLRAARAVPEPAPRQSGGIDG